MRSACLFVRRLILLSPESQANKISLSIGIVQPLSHSFSQGCAWPRNVMLYDPDSDRRVASKESVDFSVSFKK